MPIYNYRCTSCGHEDEVILSIDKRDEPRLHCGTEMVRIFLPTQPHRFVGSIKTRILDEFNQPGAMSDDYKRRAMTGF